MNNEKHNHNIKIFVEEGCTDNMTFMLCECGFYHGFANSMYTIVNVK
jgi:hypothetical protein